MLDILAVIEVCELYVTLMRDLTAMIQITQPTLPTRVAEQMAQVMLRDIATNKQNNVGLVPDNHLTTPI